MRFLALATFGLCTASAAAKLNYTCPDYLVYAEEYHAPFSAGRYNLSSQRPPQHCRTFNSSAVETTLTRLNTTIADPDLARLFVNSFPNTLDTAIRWKGYAANNSAEELTFIITGDINAMWLRDSANQMQSYLSVLTPSSLPNSLASLYRGVINLQSRYINTSPHCNAFQPPVESNIAPGNNTSGSDDMVTPPVSNRSVFECKYELDSLAAFLEISTNYFDATNDTSFFSSFQWIPTIQTILNTVSTLQVGTYSNNGSVNNLTYTFTRLTTASTETQSNKGRGNPVYGGTGLIRSFYRPSDDSTIYQLFIPANMMFARYLGSCATIMSQLNTTLSASLATQMRALSSSLYTAIETYGVVTHPTYGRIYAYEIDGYGSQNIMDDANIPSLLSAPVYGYLNASNPVYQNTRSLLLSSANPYYDFGPIISSIGGPHDSFGYVWPMASIVRILSSDNDTEIRSTLKTIVSSTDGLGLIHESINARNVSDWTRQWFSWANGLFGQMVLDLEKRKPELLAESYQ